MNEYKSITMQVQVNKNVDPSFSPYLQFFYVLDGTISIEVSNMIYHLLKDEIIMVPPFYYHTLIGEHGSFISLKLSRDLLKVLELPGAFSVNPFVYSEDTVTKDGYSSLRTKFSQIFKLYCHDDEQSKAKLMGMIASFLSDIIEQYGEPSTWRNAGKDQSAIQERYIRIMQYVHDHWNEAITIRDIAQREFLSVGYLSSFFKKYTGDSLLHYMTEIRLQKASRDLTTSKKSITEIALNNGFRNPSAFIAAFRNRFGDTPRDYRKKNESEGDAAPHTHVVSGDDYAIDLEDFLSYSDIKTDTTLSSRIPNEIHEIKVDMLGKTKPLRHTWKRLLNVGYARDVLLADVQKQILNAQKEIGFEYLRFHGLLDEDMHIYHEDENQDPYLDFSRVDLLTDFILSTGMKPYIEFSFMPLKIAKNRHRVYDRESYFSVASDYDKWQFLISGLINHFIERYHIELVSQWRFTTIGYNLVPVGLLEKNEYFDLYRMTYESVKSVNKQLQFGGPGCASSIAFSGHLFEDFLEYAIQECCVPDFICTQCYPNHLSDSEKDFLAFTFSQKAAPAVISEDEHYTLNMLLRLREKLNAYGLQRLNIWIEEWNATFWQRDLSNDTCYKSCWLGMNLCNCYDLAESYGYWTLTDFLEEHADFGTAFHGGYGLHTFNGIPKSGWLGMKLINMLGNELLQSGEGWMITKNKDGIVILLTHYCHYENLYRMRFNRLTDPRKAYDIFITKGNSEYRIAMKNLPSGQYKISKYSVSKERGSSFDLWIEMGMPKTLRQREVDYLISLSQPQYYTDIKRIEGEYLLHSKLIPHEIQIISLKKVHD